jgi:hypothetical protein
MKEVETIGQRRMHRRERGWGVTKPFVFLTPWLEAEANARDQIFPFLWVQTLYTSIYILAPGLACSLLENALEHSFFYLPFQSASKITQKQTHTLVYADARHAWSQRSHSCRRAIFSDKNLLSFQNLLVVAYVSCYVMTYLKVTMINSFSFQSYSHFQRRVNKLLDEPFWIRRFIIQVNIPYFLLTIRSS